MVDFSFKLSCLKAEPYFYDFLDFGDGEPVPDSVIDHINNCVSCRQKVDQLKDTLLQLEEQSRSEQKRIESPAMYMFQRELSLVDKPVTCHIVKPFLPYMLAIDLEVKVPTPITVHLDNCPQCREDLEAIAKLDLEWKYLCKLALLLIDSPKDGDCLKIKPAIPAIVSMDWTGVETTALSHVCRCRSCRHNIYEERQKIIDNLPFQQPQQFPCESVKANEIFDYCFPIEIDPENDEYNKFRPAFTSHAIKCPDCLAKMQDLHTTICKIIERPQPCITTVYHIDNSAAENLGKQTENLYAGFPIKVEVQSSEESIEPLPASNISIASVLKRKVSSVKFSPLLKAAAAVILFFFVINTFFNTPATGDVTIRRIYEAIEKINNVHISAFSPENGRIVQEKWISRSLNIYMTKTDNLVVFWDLGKARQRIRDINAGGTEDVNLTDDQVADIKSESDNSLALMPFQDLSLIPEDARWESVTDISENMQTDLDVYDLTWSNKAPDGSLGFNKYRFFIDRKTMLPKQIEYYHKSFYEEKYNLASKRKIEYHGDEEISNLLKKLSF